MACVNTAKEREAKFREDLEEFLKVHEAQLEIGSDFDENGFCSGTLTVTMPSWFGEDGNPVSEFCEFEL